MFPLICTLHFVTVLYWKLVYAGIIFHFRKHSKLSNDFSMICDYNTSNITQFWLFGTLMERKYFLWPYLIILAPGGIIAAVADADKVSVCPETSPELEASTEEAAAARVPPRAAACIALNSSWWQSKPSSSQRMLTCSQNNTHTWRCTRHTKIADMLERRKGKEQKRWV